MQGAHIAFSCHSSHYWLYFFFLWYWLDLYDKAFSNWVWNILIYICLCHDDYVILTNAPWFDKTKNSSINWLASFSWIYLKHKYSPGPTVTKKLKFLPLVIKVFASCSPGSFCLKDYTQHSSDNQRCTGKSCRSLRATFITMKKVQPMC